jgi:hypothetical protein
VTTRQIRAQERARQRARLEANRQEGLRVQASMVCPRCGFQLQHNNTLAGVTWLQCPTPTSVYLTPGPGCGWQILFDRDG